MQALWSRAAQTAACRCHACAQASGRAARQAPSAAAKRRRMVTSDLFITFYSTAIAAAALADTKAKENRSAEWERAIAAVKADLQRQRDPVAEEKPPELREHVAAAIATNISPRHVSQVLEVGKHFRGRLHTPPKHEIDRVGHFTKLRERKNTPQLENCQDTVAGLIADLQTETQNHIAKNPQNEAPPERQREVDTEFRKMAASLRDFKDKKGALPSYELQPPEYLRQEREALVSSINSIFSKPISTNLDLAVTVAKLCYNLSVSSAPPSPEIWNLMVRHFSGIGMHNLGDLVIHRFISDPILKPTSETCEVFLEHYVSKRDPAGFSRLVRRMRGDDFGFAVKHWVGKEWHDNEEFSALRSKRPTMRFQNKLYEKFPRNIDIFHTLISGSLQLWGIRRAVMYFEALLREGWQCCPSTLMLVIRRCITSADPQAARKFLHFLIRWWYRSADVETEFAFSASIRDHLSLLFSFCGLNPIGNSPHPRTFLPREDLQFMIRDIQIQSLTDAVDVLGQRTKILRLQVKEISERDSLEQPDLHRILDDLSTQLPTLPEIWEWDKMVVPIMSMDQTAMWRCHVRRDSWGQIVAWQTERELRNKAKLVKLDKASQLKYVPQKEPWSRLATSAGDREITEMPVVSTDEQQELSEPTRAQVVLPEATTTEGPTEMAAPEVATPTTEEERDDEEEHEQLIDALPSQSKEQGMVYKHRLELSPPTLQRPCAEPASEPASEPHMISGLLTRPVQMQLVPAAASG